MPDVSSQIDNVAEQISLNIDKASNELLADLYAIRRSMTAGQFTEIMLNADIEGMLTKKIAKAESLYINAHKTVLEGTKGFASIEPKKLTMFLEFNKQAFDKSIVTPLAANMKDTIARGIVAGLRESEIVAMVESTTISVAQIETVVNTQLNNYSRVVTNEMMKNAPKTAKYTYVGPSDDKTRPYCAEMIEAGELTLEQIEEKFADALIAGGGYNCRHKWEITDAG